MPGNPLPKLHLLLRSGEFSSQNGGALSPAFSVYNAEYIISCSLSFPSHLFMWHSHFPLDHPMNEYAWHEKCILPFSVPATGSLCFHGFMHTLWNKYTRSGRKSVSTSGPEYFVRQNSKNNKLYHWNCITENSNCVTKEVTKEKDWCTVLTAQLGQYL